MEQQELAKEEAIKAGTEFHPDTETKFPEINPPEFETNEEKFVICIDTLG